LPFFVIVYFMPRLLAVVVVGMLALGSPVDTVHAAPQVRVLPVDGGQGPPGSPGSIDALAAPAGIKAIVFLFTSTDCPISNRYAPEVRRLATTYGPKGVAFRLVYPNPAETAAAIREHMAAFAYAGAAQAFRDPKLDLVKFVGATITPEAAVVVGGKVVYRGRIDDRYVDLGLERPAATTRDLGEALEAIVTGKKVPHPTTQAVGCYIADFAR
jgi:hypothetical protein